MRHSSYSDALINVSQVCISSINSNIGFYSGDSSTLNLYSCAGDGSVLQHRTGHFMEGAVDVNAQILKTNDLKVCIYDALNFPLE